MRNRTWNLRLNLDAFNAALAALQDDQERAEFLKGLSLGMNGGCLRSAPPVAMHEGHVLGLGMRREAEDYRVRQTDRGRKGGDTTRQRRGSTPQTPPSGELP